MILGLLLLVVVLAHPHLLMEAKVSLGGGQLNICGSVDIEIPVRYVPAEIDKPEKDISSVYAP